MGVVAAMMIGFFVFLIMRVSAPSLAPLYTDLSLGFKIPEFGKGTQIYFAVQNLFDRDPPVAPIYGATGFLSTGTNGYLYDVIGRQFRAGVRFKF